MSALYRPEDSGILLVYSEPGQNVTLEEFHGECSLVGVGGVSERSRQRRSAGKKCSVALFGLHRASLFALCLVRSQSSGAKGQVRLKERANAAVDASSWEMGNKEKVDIGRFVLVNEDRCPRRPLWVTLRTLAPHAHFDAHKTVSPHCRFSQTGTTTNTSLCAFLTSPPSVQAHATR